MVRLQGTVGSDEHILPDGICVVLEVCGDEGEVVESWLQDLDPETYLPDAVPWHCELLLVVPEDVEPGSGGEAHADVQFFLVEVVEPGNKRELVVLGHPMRYCHVHEEILGGVEVEGLHCPQALLCAHKDLHPPVRQVFGKRYLPGVTAVLDLKARQPEGGLPEVAPDICLLQGRAEVTPEHSRPGHGYPVNSSSVGLGTIVIVSVVILFFRAVPFSKSRPEALGALHQFLWVPGNVGEVRPELVVALLLGSRSEPGKSGTLVPIIFHLEHGGVHDGETDKKVRNQGSLTVRHREVEVGQVPWFVGIFIGCEVDKKLRHLLPEAHGVLHDGAVVRDEVRADCGW